jgi:hypothetical protein
MKNKYNIRYLNPDEFDFWDRFVDECDQGTIFNKAIWLQNLVKFNRSHSLKIVGCFDNNNSLIAGFAHVLERKLKIFKLIVQPAVTPYTGIIYKQRASNYPSKIENQRFKILNEVIYFLDKNYDLVTILLSPQTIDIRSFIWEKYTHKVFYTYSSTIINTDEIFNSFDPDIKRQIKKLSNENFEVIKDESIQVFFELQEKSFQRQDHNFTFGKTHFMQFMKDIESLKCYKVFSIYRDNDPVYASIVLFYKQKAYYWLAGGDPLYFSKGFNKILIWEIIKELKKEGVTHFDFIGANTKTVSKYKSNYGFILTPYYRVEKANNKLLKILLFIKSLLK